MLRKHIITTFLFLLCAFAGAQAQQLTVSSFKRMPTDFDARVNHTIIDQNGKKCAIIKVENSNTGFTFDTGTLAVQEVEQKTGEIWVYVQPGVRKMTISHQTLGILREYIFPEQIKEATVYVMKLESGTLTAAKTLQTGYLIIESTPSEADVWINDEWLGTTPFSKKYPIGTKVQYSIRKQLYHNEVGVATVTETQTRLNVTLKPAYGSLQVNSTPTGAVVYMDENPDPAGTTPFTLPQVASGVHNLRFQKPMYEAVASKIEVVDSQTATITANLPQRFATITINSLPGATIEIDGQVKGTGTVEVTQEVGICDIKATLAGHRDAQQQITVEAGKDETIQLNPTPIYGSLAVESTPMGANIFVDGKACGTTPNIIPQLLIGEHSVLITKPGCADHKTAVTITENQETVCNAKLQTGAQVSISTDGVGDDVYVNGQKVGKTPLTTTLSFGSHKVYAMRGTKKSQKKTVDITSAVQKEEIKFSLGPLEFNVRGVKFSMIEVEGGTFTMGATSEQGSDALNSEKPAHNVTLDTYHIGQTEVTQALWRAVMGNNPSYHKGDDLPVENVSWNDCQEFIKKLNALTGKKFRLPTEAEWEYAARGGKHSRGYKYSGNNKMGKVAWCENNSGDKPHAVATKKANELGIYDMSGNVWEWCSDWYGSYSSFSQVDPVGPSSGSSRVLRGGSWLYSSRYCRVSNRDYDSPGDSSYNLGLRLVLDEKEVNVPTKVLNDNATANSGKNMDFTVKGVKFSMVEVAGGTFTMGATSEQGSDALGHEKPTHKVTLDTYHIGQTEVTQALWQAVMGYNPSYHKGENLPVEQVSWNECQEFIKKLNALTGKKFRLPTEAEWEYAARGGNRSLGYKYSGSNNIDEIAWTSNSGSKTHAVATKKANELGIYDMSGNVWEWCNDRYGNYSSSSQVDPVGPSSGSSRVSRGGSKNFGSKYSRVSSRSYCSPGDSYGDLGLRLVLDEKEVNVPTNVLNNNATPVNSGKNVDATTNVLNNNATPVNSGKNVDFTVKGVKFSMVKVEGGTFTMGATDEQGSGDYRNDEKPTHKVTLNSYLIGQTEVTQALWKTVMGNNPSYRKGDNLPVEQVSWNDCQEFVKKLNALTGKKFRLPTEAEWEYAARGGNRSRGYKYSGSNYIDGVAWYDGNSGSKTHAVGGKKANELGIYDMSGNVWEWCSDWYGSYSSLLQTNPVGPYSGSGRVLRGGSWDYSCGECRVSRRLDGSPGISRYYLGLRLVLVP